MLILDNIKKQDRKKFIDDFDKLLKNPNNINVGFNFNEINFNVELFKYKYILFNFNNYDNVEKKIIKNIICYYLLKDYWQYVYVEKYLIEDKYYYTVVHYDTIIDKNIGGKKCEKNRGRGINGLGMSYMSTVKPCDNSKGYGVIYDKINNTVNYYSAHAQYCIYHCDDDIRHLYNLNSLFDSKYKEFKLSLTTNNINIINTIDNTKDVKNNNNDKIIIQIITNTINIPMEFTNMNFEQILNKLILLFGEGKITYDNNTYKFIKNY